MLATIYLRANASQTYAAIITFDRDRVEKKLSWQSEATRWRGLSGGVYAAGPIRKNAGLSISRDGPVTGQAASVRGLAGIEKM